MTTVPYIFLNFYAKFFESTVWSQNLGILTEHKPAWNHVTRTPAKSQKQQRPLALHHAMVGWTRVLGFQSCSQKSQTTPKPVTLLLHTPVCICWSAADPRRWNPETNDSHSICFEGQPRRGHHHKQGSVCSRQDVRGSSVWPFLLFIIVIYRTLELQCSTP